MTLTCAGRTLLEVEIKGLVVALLHEAEHAQQAAQRAAALSSLQASPSCSRSSLQSVLWQVDGAMLRYPCASCSYQESHTIRNVLSAAERWDWPMQDAAQMPYSLLHPLRPHLMRGLDRAVDDRKRDVRMAAVRCRRAWTAPHT